MSRLNYPDVPVGSVLPELTVDVTATLIVAGAIASRDFQDVHHDSALAKQRGTKDIFMNILTTNGLVCRYVTDWAGVDAIVRGTSIRLGVPAFPGEQLTFSGVVSAAEPLADGGVVTVDVSGRGSLGEHVTGTVRVELP
jgi:acyl dehydratase